jgi:DNA-binding SARP family transcriptional activator
MAHLSLTLLGGFHARYGPLGRPLDLARKKAQALLAYLSLRPGHTHSRESLTTLLWSDSAVAQARNSFRVTLFALRRALRTAQVPCLSVKGNAVTLDSSGVEVDVVTFRRLVAKGTADALRSASGLFAGELLEGLAVGEGPFEEWLTAEREQLRALAFHAFQRSLDHDLEAGAQEEALGTALRLLSLDPLQEQVHRSVMELQAELGRPGAALRQYQTCLAVLERELGVSPAVETQQLYQRILRREPSAAPSLLHGGGTDAPRRDRPPHLAPAEPRLPQGTALVGRHAEMGRLTDALDAASIGRARAVAVLGEAGAGKTRLMAELAALVHRRRYRLLLGRGHESERILPLAPWVDAIRASGALDEPGFADALGAPWTSELARLFPEIGGRATAPEQGHHGRLFEAMVRLFRHLAARGTTVLLLEDLHWADEVSARLLGFLGRRAATWPLLVVFTAREEELDRASALRRVLDELDLTGLGSRLTLGPLARAETMELVAALHRSARRDDDAEMLAEKIWAVSHGNPFLIVETMNVLHEGGRVSPAGALPLPPRVCELVTGRVDRLGERSRRLLALATVIGRAFEFPLLQRASGLAGLDAAEGVEELVRRRLLHAVGDGLDVTHDWIREIVYDQLPIVLRRTLHSAVAEALEARHAADPDRHAAALAHHYREGEVWDKAFAYLHAAGREAAARFGHREAVSRYETALEVSRHLPQTAHVLDRALDLRIDLRYSLSGLGEFERLASHLREAEPVARRLGDERRLGWVLVYTSYYFRMTGRFDEARAVEAQARAIAVGRGDAELEREADYERGMVCLFAGDARGTIEALGRVVKATDATRRITGWTAVTKIASRAYLAQALAMCGRFEEGLVRGEEAVRVAEAAESPTNTIIACTELASVHMMRGEYARAVPLLERSLWCAREHEITLFLPKVLGSLACAYGQVGRIADGLAMLEEFQKAMEQAGALGSRGRVVVNAGELCLAAGDLDAAERLASQGLVTLREWGMRRWEAETLTVLGDIALGRPPGDLRAAERHYREALGTAVDLELRPLAATCHLGLGRVHRLARRPVEATTALETARAMFGEMGMRRGHEAAEAELARLARPRRRRR